MRANPHRSQKNGHRKRVAWLPAAPVSVSRARSIVSEAATEAGLTDEGRWDVLLATSEVFANAIQHGEAWPNGCILLVTEPCVRGLRVEVADCGRFESTLEPAPLEATGGRGIGIIAAIVDRLEVQNGNGQTVVSFERDAPDPRSQVAA